MMKSGGTVGHGTEPPWPPFARIMFVKGFDYTNALPSGKYAVATTTTTTTTKKKKKKLGDISHWCRFLNHKCNKRYIIFLAILGP